jgi:very-short-patch-repair endonuclease
MMRQLEGVGLSKRAAAGRVRSGRLYRVHRGVYSVGHSAPSWHGRWMAAVLACADGAVLSHHSAAALWELLKPIDGAIHVSIPTLNGRKPQRGIHLHRCPSLSPPPREPSPSPSYLPAGGRGRRLLTTHRHRIPVTTIQRTIDDLEGTVPPHLFRRAKRQAELKGIHLEGVERHRQRSDLEEDFYALVNLHHLPLPETNVKLGRHEVDFLWREQRLVVETDSYLYHRGSISFEEDHARDLDLRQLGYIVLRFTDSQIENEPDRVIALVADALGVAPLPGL